MQRYGQVVAATLVTPSDKVTFPIVDTQDSKGGRHYFDSIEDRNKKLPASHRTVGMVVHVGKAVNKDYILKPGAPETGNTSDRDWEEYAPGVPPGVLTAHQKEEDIQFRNIVIRENGAKSFSTLDQYLQWLESEVNKRLTNHQNAEDIRYGDQSIFGYPTLRQHLEALSRDIQTAGEDQFIDSPIQWSSRPTTQYPATGLYHKQNLDEELKQIYTYLNDPTLINVNASNTDTTKITLQEKLNRIDSHVPHIEEITSTDTSVTLVSWLEKYKKPENCEWDNTMNLRQKIESISSTLGNASFVQTITWNNQVPTSPSNLSNLTNGNNLSTDLIYIFTQLEDMNKDDKIKVFDNGSLPSGKTLRDRLNELASSITVAGAAQFIEDIDWSSKPASPNGLANVNGNGLKDQLIALWTKLENMNDPDYIEIPKNTIGNTNAISLTQALTNLYNDLTTLRVEDLLWNAGTYTKGSYTYGGKDVPLKNTIEDIYDKLSGLSSSVGGITVDIEHTKWTTRPTFTYPQSVTGSDITTIEHKATLSDELKQIYKLLNDPTLIPVYSKRTSGGAFDSDNTATTLKDKIIQLNTDVAALNSVSSTITINNEYLKKIIKGYDGSDSDTVAAPQYLLFSLSEDVELGSFKTQEYLVAWSGYIEEVVAYISLNDYVANSPIQIIGALEIAPPSGTGGGAYVLHSNAIQNSSEKSTEFAIGTVTDQSSADYNVLKSKPVKPSKLSVMKDSRIRVNIISTNPNPLSLTCLSIRVKIVCEAAHSITI